MGLIDDYVKSVYRHASVHALYPPETGVEVGQVFVKKDDAYARETSLTAEGIAFTTTTAEVGSFDSTASDGTSVDAVLKGKLPDGTPAKAIVDGEVGVAVKLTGKSSYAMNLHDVRTEEIENLREIKRAIVKRFLRNDWDDKYIVVTKRWLAKNTTIAAGSDSETSVEFKAKADVGPEKAKLVNLAADFGIVNKAKASMTIDGKPDVVAIFRGYKFSVRDILGAAEADIDPDSIIETEWDPTLDG